MILTYAKKINPQKKYIRAAAFLMAFLLIFSNITISVSSEASTLEDGVKINIKNEGLPLPSHITAQAAVVLNLDTDAVIYEKYGDKIIFPASTVKLMTAILVLENVSDLDGQTIISQEVVKKTVGNNIDMIEGEVFTIKDLLNAMLIFGANDAAIALAEYVSGSEGAFVAKMNERAKELGCEHTEFANSYGMHSDAMYSTALDIAKIARHAASIQQIMDITSTSKYDIDVTNKTDTKRDYLFNRNHFITKGQTSRYYYSSAKGMNAGSTKEAGYCLVTTATQNGVTYLCVIIGASSTPIENGELVNSFSDARTLLEWGFSIYSYRSVLSQKEIIHEVEIKLSASKDYVGLVPDKDIDALLPQNVDIKTEILKVYTIYDDKLVARIEKGQHLGDLTVSYGGNIIGTAKLLANAEVERSNILYVLSRINGVVSTRWFQASVVIFLILFSFYVIITVIGNSKKTKRRFI